AHAGPAPAVGNAEGLVQVQVADVGADVTGPREADLRVHVGAVHVDLAPVLVDDLADLADRLLEDAVRRRVRDHERAQVVGVRLRLRLQVFHVDVAPRVARYRHHLEPGHGRARRVGAVGRHGDEAHVAVRLV